MFTVSIERNVNYGGLDETEDLTVRTDHPVVFEIGRHRSPITNRKEAEKGSAQISQEQNRRQRTWKNVCIPPRLTATPV